MTYEELLSGHLKITKDLLSLCRNISEQNNHIDYRKLNEAITEIDRANRIIEKIADMCPFDGKNRQKKVSRLFDDFHRKIGIINQMLKDYDVFRRQKNRCR